MRRYLSFFILLVAATLVSLPLAAQEETDDSTLVVSLLTCSPGQQTYELYGHTALRVRSARDSYDIVYNFGAFSFDQPHFVWRFVLGECDYLLMPCPFGYFMAEYAYRGSSVIEQTLNLIPPEAARLANALATTALPENCVYRYNIFRSNCTTKARDIIEENVFGVVRYPARSRRNSFRSILHQFTNGHEWAREGNDLLLGADVDTLITERDEMFSPIYMMWYADSAMIDGDVHGVRPLVAERRELLAADPSRQQMERDSLPSFPLTPALLGWGMLVVGLLIALWEWRRRCIFWPLDVVLMFFQGVAGLLLVFMALWSQHPAVASNWQVWVLNPLPLFFLPFVVRADLHRQRFIYHAFAAGFLLLFIIVYAFLPQHFSQFILPVALLLLSRAVVHVLVYRQKA